MALLYIINMNITCGMLLANVESTWQTPKLLAAKLGERLVKISHFLIHDLTIFHWCGRAVLYRPQPV